MTLSHLFVPFLLFLSTVTSSMVVNISFSKITYPIQLPFLDLKNVSKRILTTCKIFNISPINCINSFNPLHSSPYLHLEIFKLIHFFLFLKVLVSHLYSNTLYIYTFFSKPIPYSCTEASALLFFPLFSLPWSWSWFLTTLVFLILILILHSFISFYNFNILMLNCVAPRFKVSQDDRFLCFHTILKSNSY